MEIRELTTPEDLRSCAGLLRLAFAETARNFGLTEQNAPTNAAFATVQNLHRHLQGGMILYGMFLAGALTGCVAIKQSNSAPGVFYIERLAVSPADRNRGYGERLLAFALERIRDRGGTEASLGLIDDNVQLKRWYASRGFVQRERRRVAHLPFKVCYMSAKI